MVAKRATGLNFASIFSGCGGFDLGFIQAGFHCKAAFDIEPDAVEVHCTNIPGRVARVADLSKPGFDCGLRAIDVLLAGPPCQGFSTAGKRKLNDPRNRLLLDAGRLALAIKPKVLVVENVTGVTKGPHKRYWNALRELLREHQYATMEFRCVGLDFGLAQIRTRMVLLAWNTGRLFDNGLARIPGGFLRNALEKMPCDLPNHSPKLLATDTEAAQIAGAIRPNQKLSNVRGGDRSVHTWAIPGVFGHTTGQERRVLDALLHLRRRNRCRKRGDADPVAASVIAEHLGRTVAPDLKRLMATNYVRRKSDGYDLTHTFNGKYRRLDWDQPSPTVDTRFTNARYFLHPDEDRAFTVREAARIQGFPDTFRFSGSERAQSAMVGNAVPPPMARILADFIRTRVLV